MKSPEETLNFLRSNTSYSVTRLGALYKDFKDAKELNPEGYEANLISWYNIFKVILQHDFLPQAKLSIPHKNPDLSKILTLPVIGNPLSLDLVINELVDKKHLIPVSTFMSYDKNFHSYITPDSSVLKYISPLHWLNQVSLLGANLINVLGGSSSERYIPWTSICEFGKHFMSVLNKIEIVEGIYSSQIFDERLLLMFIHTNISSNFTSLDLQILLKYLSRDTGECSVKTSEDDTTTVIKFIKNTEVTQEDKDIAQVKYNIHEISQRMSGIENKIHELNRRISLYPTEKIKTDETIKNVVMTLLSQRKHQQKTFQHSVSIYTQLNEILVKIDSATSNIKIFNVLKQSSKTLQSLNAQVNVDDIDHVNSDIRDQIDQTDEISDALGSNNAEDQEVEEEFNELLKEQQKEEKQDDILLHKLKDLNVADKIQPTNDSEIQSNELRLEDTRDIEKPLTS